MASKNGVSNVKTEAEMTDVQTDVQRRSSGLQSNAQLGPEVTSWKCVNLSDA